MKTPHWISCLPIETSQPESCERLEFVLVRIVPECVRTDSCKLRIIPKTCLKIFTMSDNIYIIERDGLLSVVMFYGFDAKSFLYVQSTGNFNATFVKYPCELWKVAFDWSGSLKRILNERSPEQNSQLVYCLVLDATKAPQIAEVLTQDSVLEPKVKISMKISINFYRCTWAQQNDVIGINRHLALYIIYPPRWPTWLSHRLMDWYVLGSHLGIGSNPEPVF